MKLTPRMIQSMEILQLPIMALKERVDQGLRQNPPRRDFEVDPPASNPDAPPESNRPDGG